MRRTSQLSTRVYLAIIELLERSGSIGRNLKDRARLALDSQYEPTFRVWQQFVYMPDTGALVNFDPPRRRLGIPLPWGHPIELAERGKRRCDRNQTSSGTVVHVVRVPSALLRRISPNLNHRLTLPIPAGHNDFIRVNCRDTLYAERCRVLQCPTMLGSIYGTRLIRNEIEP